jgi:hypothetical protein
MVDILSEILKRIKEAEKQMTEAIASGINVYSFDIYQKLVGKREGLNESLLIIESILSEDDEE